MEIPEKHFLYPSTVFAHRAPHVVQTVLGSCVAVCLFDRLGAFGGMNHFMLPLWKGEGLASPKFGNVAMEHLLERMLTSGCNERHLVAKVFGGADVNQSLGNIYRIGSRNVAVAMGFLQDRGIPVTGASTGGAQGRRLVFNTRTGEVTMRLIEQRSEPEPVRSL